MGCSDTPEVQDASMEPLRYFSHDSDAADDIKCKRLIRRLGYEGYGMWWRVCELMAAATGHTLPCATDEDREILCDELRCDEEALSVFVATLADVGLIDCDALSEGRIASRRMIDNALKFGRLRVNGRRGGRPKRVQ